MKIAIPVWQDRISPVFDSSRRLLLVDLADLKVAARQEIELGGESAERVRRLSDSAVETLICGAISESLAEQVLAAGIRLIPFVAGEVSEILDAYADARLPSPEFLMPGCHANGRKEPKHPRCGAHGRSGGSGERDAD